MRTIKIKTRRLKNYHPDSKLEYISDYSGTGDNLSTAKLFKYNPSEQVSNAPEVTPLKTGYKTKSIKEGV